jgi:hypothetical protein
MNNSPPTAPVAANGVVSTEGTVTDSGRQERPRNRIQVSREKRPLNFFVGLAKKFLLNESEVELSGLGLAVTTVVTVAEILKSSGHVEITRTVFLLPALSLVSTASFPLSSFSFRLLTGADD